METAGIISGIAGETGLRKEQIESVLSLTEEGCTIPFIARYRKEKTGNLDEVAIQQIISINEKITELEKRREYILSYLKDNDKLDAETKKALVRAQTLNELEDIYLPFKPRKKTLADRAIELGTAPLAEMIKSKNMPLSEALKQAEAFVSDEIPDAAAAFEHAINILVQETSDSADARKEVRQSLQKGKLSAKVRKTKKDDEEAQKYRDFFEHTEDTQKVPPHRVMALLRAEKEKIISLKLDSDEDETILSKKICRRVFNADGEVLVKAAAESVKRHLHPSISNEILKDMKERAELESVRIFSRNLEKMLLFSPFGEKAVIGIDPGIRTGCKAALLDERGDFVNSTTMYLNRDENEANKIMPWIDKYNIKAIAIGSGTYGRETYKIFREILKDSTITIAMVDEDGASVYSAGETAREEFPELDLTVRGAISIGRRFQDPMAELVKIEPESLGVGQYQHDITPSLLKDNLEQAVQWAVNRVGVNLNTAGYHLLSQVSGLDRKKALEIAKYRREKGRIESRKELKKIKGIGDKAFEQSAGFLRIKDGKEVLDSTGVHPEAYPHVKEIAGVYGLSTEEIIHNPSGLNENEIRKKLDIPELSSILDELLKKGLDPRDEYTAASFTEGRESIDNLKEGMVLQGTVDNVAAFGAFIDLGIKENGLVHISEVADEYISDITDVLSVGDSVSVKVIAIDKNRKRISLSIKQAHTVH